MMDPNTLLERVHDGMTVVDAAGEKLGTVEFVKMGEGDAVTAGADQLGFREGAGIDSDGPQPGGVFVAGQGMGGSGGMGAGTAGFLGGNFAPVPGGGDADTERRLNVFEEGEPDVPKPLRDRLLREGFIKIDGYGPNFLDTDRYVPARHVASVAGDTVTLNIRRDQIATERDGW